MNFRGALPPSRLAPPDWTTRVGLEGVLVENRDEAVTRVVRRCRTGDIVVVCGMADDLTAVARSLVAQLDA